MDINKVHCYSHSRRLNETRDCTVVACAVATQIDYPTMRDYLTEYGREHRKGLSPSAYHRALRDLGLKLTRLRGPVYEYEPYYVRGHEVRRNGQWYYKHGHYRTRRRKVSNGIHYNCTTVASIAKELTKGIYLVSINGHVLCLKDGKVHDWTSGRRHRITSVYKVEEQ